MTKREAAIVEAAEKVIEAFDKWLADNSEHARLNLRSAGMQLAIAKKKRLGANHGRPPYGFRYSEKGSRWVPDAAEQRVLRMMRAWRSEGRSYQRIASSLNALGERNRSGRPWNQGCVYEFLERKRQGRDREQLVAFEEVNA